MSHDTWSKSFAKGGALDSSATYLLKSIKVVEDVVDGVLGDAAAGGDLSGVAGKIGHHTRIVYGRELRPNRLRGGVEYAIVSGPNSRGGASYALSSVGASAVIEAVFDGERMTQARPPAAAVVLQMLGEVTEIRRGKITVHTADPDDPGEEIELTLRLSETAPEHRDELSRPGTVVDISVRRAPDGALSYRVVPARGDSAPADAAAREADAAATAPRAARLTRL